MSINLFKTDWKIYTQWLLFTWTLKKTKKDCREAYKKNWNHYDEPAKLTPKVISETYDKIKEFLDVYYEPHKEEWWKRKIITTADTAEYSTSAKCKIVIYTKDSLAQFDSTDHMQFSQRRRLCFAFFDDIKPDDISKEYIINAVKFEINSPKEEEEDIPF